RGAHVALFGIAILNSELAYFMAIWLILDPIFRHALRERGAGAPARLDWKTAGTGAGLLAGGILLVETLRRTLLVHETLPQSAVPEHATYGRDFHFTLAQNLVELRAGLHVRLATGYPVLVPLFMLAVVLLAVQLLRTDRERCAALSVVTIGMVASILCFADIYESRVLMPLIPFVAMNGWQALSP